VSTEPHNPGTGEEIDTSEPERPKGNGSKPDWVAYGVAMGYDEAELDAMSRDDIRDMFAEVDAADPDADLEDDGSED
jgi:hypothetical protein